MSSSDEEEYRRIDNLVSAANELSSAKAKSMFKYLKSSPNDFELRMQALGYLQFRLANDNANKASFVEHFCWLIEHHPLRLQRHFQIFNPVMTYRQRLECYLAWKRKAEENLDSVEILIVASERLDSLSKALAEKYLLRAKEIAPKNDDVARALSGLYQIWGSSFEELALAEYDRFLDLNDLEVEILYSYYQSRVAKLAYNAGWFEIAKKAALLSLENIVETDDFKSDPRINFTSHTVLGLLALKEKKNKQAISHLFSSFPEGTKRTFIPNFSLIAELHELGEKLAVEEFLEKAKPIEKVLTLHGYRTLERSLKEELPTWRRYRDLATLPRTAFDSRRFEVAKEAALEYKKLSLKFEDEPDYGIHIGEIVLGQLELKQGNINEAIKHLQNAIPLVRNYSYVEDIDCNLCLDLLKENQQKSVVDFLKECKANFKGVDEEDDCDDSFLLDEWISQIEKNEIPWEWTVQSID
ncbi:hypothetical protein KA183_18650 [bacterium]|nr:hypothetical protein [bacterium]QQR58847.1 MAG: hypothetical protein IPG59_04955 [Candidatus Melainabacteria bacterium]